MDDVFKALAGPSRRKLLDRLHRDNGQTLAGLCGPLDMTRQAVTKHLNLLEQAKLILFSSSKLEKRAKTNRRAVRVTVQTTPAKEAYLHHDRFCLSGKFRTDGSIESMAPLKPLPPRIPAQGKLF